MIIKTFTALEFDDLEPNVFRSKPMAQTKWISLIPTDWITPQNYRDDHRRDVPVTSAFLGRGNDE